MPAFSGPVKGRSIQVKRGVLSSEVLVAGVRTKSVAIAGEPIDVSNDDSGAWAEKLIDAGQISVTISVAGVAKNHTLLAESLNTTDRDQSTVFLYPGGGVIQGNFFLSSYQENGEYNGAALFEAEFVSNGAVTYTPGA